MKIAPNAFAKLFCSPLMLHAPVRETLQQRLLAHMEVSTAIPVAIQNDTDKRDMNWRVGSIYDTFRNVAVVRLHGVIDKMISSMEMECYGGCDLDDFDAALALAEGNTAIDTVVIHVHSPGGSCTGTPESTARVARLRELKEVHVYTSTECCSAAYHIASQADIITSTPSAIVGSIGVYMAMLDRTIQLQKEGIKVELIQAGRLKAMGASFKTLSEEERAILQGQADKLWAGFKAACQTLRDIDEETMQGQWFLGDEAKARNLVDYTTELTIDEYVSQLVR